MNSQTWSPSHSATVQGSSQGWSPRRSPAQRTIWYDDRMTCARMTGGQDDKILGWQDARVTWWQLDRMTGMTGWHDCLHKVHHDAPATAQVEQGRGVELIQSWWSESLLSRMLTEQRVCWAESSLSREPLSRVLIRQRARWADLSRELVEQPPWEESKATAGKGESVANLPLCVINIVKHLQMFLLVAQLF